MLKLFAPLSSFVFPCDWVIRMFSIPDSSCLLLGGPLCQTVGHELVSHFFVTFWHEVVLSVEDFGNCAFSKSPVSWQVSSEDHREDRDGDRYNLSCVPPADEGSHTDGNGKPGDDDSDEVVFPSPHVSLIFVPTYQAPVLSTDTMVRGSGASVTRGWGLSVVHISSLMALNTG